MFLKLIGDAALYESEILGTFAEENDVPLFTHGM